MSDFDTIEADKLAFLDVGNTTTKVGFRQESQWEIHSLVNSGSIIELLNTREIEYVVASSVRPDSNWLDDLVNFFSVAVLETSDISPQHYIYKTPETLGMDRFLACLGAYNLEKSNVLVIDAGSACTIDYMSRDGIFEGGVIMPGVQTLLKVFHKAAPGLPNFDFEIPFNFPGTSSKDSLQWGLSQLFVDGIIANVNRFWIEKGEFQIFVTGGDAKLVKEHLNRDAILRSDLIFIGMEAFLED